MVEKEGFSKYTAYNTMTIGKQNMTLAVKRAKYFTLVW